MKWLILLTAAVLSGCAVHGPGQHGPGHDGSGYGGATVYGSSAIHGSGYAAGAPYLQPDPFYTHPPTQWLGGGPAFSPYGWGVHAWSAPVPQIVVPPLHVRPPRGPRPHGRGQHWSGRDRDHRPGWGQREHGGSGWRDRPGRGGEHVTPQRTPGIDRDRRSLRPGAQGPGAWQRPGPAQRSEGGQGRRGGGRP